MGHLSPDPRLRLAQIRNEALDLDGTIYRGGLLFLFTLPFLQLLEELDIGHTLLTNNPSRSTEDYLIHLKNMNVDATREQVFTMARRADALSILVLTGEATADEAVAFEPAPDIVAPDLAAFGELLRHARDGAISV